MAGFAPWGLALGGVGSIFSYFQQQQQQRQMQAMMQQIFGNQQQLQNRELGVLGGLQNEANQYTSLLPGLTGLETQSMQQAGSQVPGAESTYLQDAQNPAALAAATGINAGGLTRNATDYLSNFGGTNVGKLTPQQLSMLGNANTNLAGTAPGAQAFYGREATGGLNQQFQTNAQNQLQQGFNQSVNDIKASATPGQNISAAEQAAQNSLLSSRANLGSQLAGENQQVAQQGVEGQLSTSSALDQQTLQRLAQQFGVAQSADAQKSNMLTGAATLGNQYNQTVLGNQQGAAQFGQGLLDQYGNFVGQGNQLNEFNAGALGSLNSQQAQLGEFFAGQGAYANANASNPFSSIGSLLANYSQNSGGNTQQPGGTDMSGVPDYSQFYANSNLYTPPNSFPSVYTPPGGYWYPGQQMAPANYGYGTPGSQP